MEQKNFMEKFKELYKNSWSGIWGMRILSEISYLIEVSRTAGDSFHELLNEEVTKLWEYVKENGAITKEIVLRLEDELKPMQEEAKKYKVLLIGHAHIDMNWMWGFQETASVTVDTFETMLQLMEEYPQFTFAQSQASVYAIIEKYYPHILERIKARIKEGRWEVTASTWVENDKNMSGSEAMARQTLYTKNYLSKLLDINVDSLMLDFEPDTFGHNENMPEILNQGGIKYYYHCRGYDKEHVYRWQAPSGAEVIVYREPVWYNATVLYDSLKYVPSFCKKYGIHTALKMYGVGDHGGGPTRRDIQRWLEMQSWPLMPAIKFGTFAEFYGELEKARETLPVVKGELNYIFTGCYTSQSRLKKANRQGEDRLFEAEALDVMAKDGVPLYTTPSSFEAAWRKVLFNQFHDILPGSGTIETREYGMGEFQKALATAQINMNHAMREICKSINTAGLLEEEGGDWSFGAGAGYGTHDREGHMTGYVSRAGGKRRIMNVFNPTQYKRCEAVKVTLWDWDGDPDLLVAHDPQGKEAKCQIIGKGTHYWGHNYHIAALEATIEPMGYATYILDEKQDDRPLVWKNLTTSPCEDPRVDHCTDMPMILENEKVKAVFSPDTMKLLSLVDKASEKELISAPSCYFREVLESTQNEMTSWRVGNYTTVCDLNETAPVKLECQEKGELVQKIEYRIEKENYTVKAAVCLTAGSTILEYRTQVDWHESGNALKGIPQLNFMVPFAYLAKKYACTIPFGVIERDALAQDVPCTGLMSGIPEDGGELGVILMSDCKYGFRGYDNSVAVTLIRSSYDPDEMPEQGRHIFRIGVGVSAPDAFALTEHLECFVHPVYTCSNSAHEGILPTELSFMKVKGKVKVASVKEAEDGQGVIVRIHSLYNTSTPVIIKVNRRSVCEAYLADVLERRIEDLPIVDGNIKFTLPAGAVRTVRLVFDKK